MRLTAIQSPTRFEKTLLWTFFLVIIPALGFISEYRSAFLSRRMGDVGMLFRGAWAVAAGADLYAVTCDNGWHYNYPPLSAILLVPLADPPRGMDTAGYMPFAWSVAIFFVISLGTLFWGIHVLANALQETAADPSVRAQPRFCRRWWYLRTLPIIVACVPFGHTLIRGQINTVMVALLCVALAAWLRGRAFRAGVWLALSICAKVMPIYLLIYPLWKRDYRALAGCTAGLIVGLVVIPGLVFGPERTVTHYQTYARVMFAPLLKLSDDATRHDELLGMNATDSFGVKTALFNWTYPDPQSRPRDMSTAGKLAYVLIGIAMTFVTLWRFRSGADPAEEMSLRLGSLFLLMVLLSPASHNHYLLCVIPSVMCLAWSYMQHQDTTKLPWTVNGMFAAFVVVLTLVHMPRLDVVLRDGCAVLFASLPLWLAPVLRLWRSRPALAVVEATEPATFQRMAA